MALEEYKRKRNFKATPEPEGKVVKKKGKSKAASFVIQKHAATRLHYDFRLEMEGVLRSWAVPKGPSLDPGEKRLAVHVEDHPLDYGGFEGIIPKGQYGGGTVLLWDRGTWSPQEGEGDPVEGYRKGKLKFRLDGEKLQGGWTLVRMHGRQAGDNGENWLLIKENDETAQPGSGDAITEERPESVESGQSLEEIAADPERVWESNRTEKAKKNRTDPTDRSDELKKLPGARKAKIPAAVEAQLATLVDEVPQGEEWIHELKYDGYRALCHLKDGEARLITRNGKDWTDRFESVAREAETLPADQAILDGEVVVLEANGTTSFQALQNALSEGREKDLVYFVFDLLYLDGYDLRPAALEERKTALGALLAGRSQILRFGDHVRGGGEEFYRQACSFGLEGIVCKRADLPYHGGRSKDWLKVKCLKRQEFVIVGFTDPEGSRVGLGALLLAVYEEKKPGEDLVFAGKVGTGFNARTLRDLRKKLDKIVVDKPAFTNAPRGAEARRSHWVKPQLVAEVTFGEWTRDSLLRHSTFQGLREDKKPAEVVRERAQELPPEGKAPKAARKANMPGSSKKEIEIAGVRFTNPEKVLYPGQGVTKRDLGMYYSRIADWILPHVSNRPLTLVRCPEGQAKQCFYQKHVNEQFPKSVYRVEVEEGKQTVPYGAVDSLAGILSLVQMGVLEIHLWGAHRDDIEKPDYVVFDLDPDEGLAWERVVEGAITTRDFLAELGLKTFLKTTGGKGLHVVFPLTRRAGWDEVKAFTKAVAEAIVAREPKKYTAKLPKADRKGKVFIDYLRNGRGATSIAPFSTRARAGAPVSATLFWEELETDVRANTWTVQNLPDRLESLSGDPWEDFTKVRQSITAAMKKAVGMK